MIATANTLDDWPIFTRVLKLASIESLTSNTAASALGFFSTIRASIFTPARLVAQPTGTTAPFSAMSGPVMETSLLSVGAPPPMALAASASVLASKAVWFHAA